MAKLNHAKIIKGFEELINTTNGKDFFVGFLKTFSFPASTEASVLFPEPFGPMMACTSPAFTSRSMPFNISFPATCARKFLTESISILLFLHS